MYWKTYNINNAAKFFCNLKTLVRHIFLAIIWVFFFSDRIPIYFSTTMAAFCTINSGSVLARFSETLMSLITMWFFLYINLPRRNPQLSLKPLLDDSSCLLWELFRSGGRRFHDERGVTHLFDDDILLEDSVIYFHFLKKKNHCLLWF